MPTTGVPVPQGPHKSADREHPGGDSRRPHQYLSQPHASLNFDDSPLRMPKSSQLVHGLRMPRIDWVETLLPAQQPHSFVRKAGS
jgi:hypothetical protein